mgnify:CR=1 FL=1
MPLTQPKTDLAYLRSEKAKAEQQLRYYQHREKILEHQIPELTRKARVHRLCTRAGMLESFLIAPEELTNDQVMELYHGFVDGWFYPDVRVTTAGAIVNEGHGTSAGYELQYVRWDGVQIEHHDFWSYAKTEDVSGERVCYLDDVEVSEAVFDERLAACTADDEYVLHFLASTPENCRKYLRDSIQASRQPEQPQLNEQELLALLQENLAWLNAVEGETFFVEGQGSYMAIVSYENGQYGRIKRLVPSPATTSELESTLAEDEAIDPTFSSYYPISNYSSKEQILDNLREYMDVDSLGIMQNAYATVSDVLNDNVWEFNGGLYLVRGGRGYGVFTYDPQTTQDKAYLKKLQLYIIFVERPVSSLILSRPFRLKSGTAGGSSRTWQKPKAAQTPIPSPQKPERTAASIPARSAPWSAAARERTSNMYRLCWLS